MAPRRTHTISHDEVRARDLAEDAAFREEWQQTALARTVAAAIIGYRADHGLTQTQLGDLIGCKQSYVSRLESGEENPAINTLLRLSDTLGIEFMIDIRPAGQEQSKLANRSLVGNPDVEHTSSRGRVIAASAR
jgi:ribosome-binding protein aMBF1 (putative translation factor)